jgi:hypothetical protein
MHAKNRTNTWSLLGVNEGPLGGAHFHLNPLLRLLPNLGLAGSGRKKFEVVIA